MAAIFNRTVKMVPACCENAGGTGNEVFVYTGTNEGSVIVEHPLGRRPFVFALRVQGSDEYLIEPSIQVSDSSPYDVTVNIDPEVENYKIVLY